MSAQPKDGGPAFPGTHTEYVRGFGAGAMALPREVAHGGMSLRDYFAAKAMHPFVAWALEQQLFDGYGDAAKAAAGYAKAAYLIADAMLAEREKVQP